MSRQPINQRYESHLNGSQPLDKLVERLKLTLGDADLHTALAALAVVAGDMHGAKNIGREDFEWTFVQAYQDARPNTGDWSRLLAKKRLAECS